MGKKMRHVGGASNLAVLVAMLVVLIFLSGCSPQYDWRTVTLGDGRVRAMLPDKTDISTFNTLFV